jgi:predicted dehydrogenase/nucleoside-diphosphate-sugar epimerase
VSAAPTESIPTIESAPVATPGATPTGLASRNTRVAVVGAGFIADFHLEILRATEGVEVVAVCDQDLARAESLARKWQVAHAGRSLAELRGMSIDVAHVLVPPNLHFGVARELLDGGIGVFVEKPLALSTADAHELGRIARERKLVLGVNHNAVHHPAFAKLLARVRAGEIGRVEHVRVCLSVPLRQLDVGDFSAWMFREPRNIVFEQAPHPFAQIVELAGAPRVVATHLLASRELQPGQTFHERWVISGTAEHATVEVFLHFGAAFTRSTLEVLGSDGSLEADLFHNHLTGERKTLYLDFWNSFLAGWRRGGELRRSARGVLSDYLKLTLGLGARQDAFFAGMRASIRAFHAALRAGQAPPVDAARGALVLEWCERATAQLAPTYPGAVELPAPGKARTGEVVVLGATGFIGGRVLAKLLERGVPVTAVVRRAHSLPARLVDAARRGDVRLVRASLEDPASLASALHGANCVLQLATGNANTWEAVERAMVKGSVAIAQACIDAKVGRYVFCSSTAALYLGADARPQPVEDSLDADPRPEARSLYARGKIATERELVKLMRERGLPLVIVRPGVVLGRGTALQHSGLGLWARDNHCVGWGRGDNALPLVWVDDVADALVAIALFEGRELDGKALNLAANTGLTAAEVVAELRRASGRDLHFHPRALALSQTLEIGKWLVKKLGRRKDAAFPSWRDLASRSLAAPLACRTARERLGWKPVDERERFLELAVRSMCGVAGDDRR